MTVSSSGSVPITGHQYEITAGSFRATIAEAGATFRELWDGSRALVDGFDADEPAPGGHGQLLMPWPNRIDHGRYSFDGVTRQLDITEPPRDTAIHGLVRFAAWQVAEHESDRVRLGLRLHAHQGYPFVLDLSAEYALDAETGLSVTLGATNVGRAAAPYGAGAHPYLTVGHSIDDCVVTIPGASRQTFDDRYIPTGQVSVDGTEFDFRNPRRAGPLAFNVAYTDLVRNADGRAWARLTAPDGSAVSLWTDGFYRWLQIYSGEELPPERRRRSLAVEPMSCGPNAFVSGSGVIVLQPGQTASGAWGITGG